MTKRPTKKLEERLCALRFLENFNVKFTASDILPNEQEDSVVDIFYHNKQFQIVKADFEFQELLGVTPTQDGIQVIPFRGRKPLEIWEDYILAPVRKKNKYGQSAQGVILLIDSFRAPPSIKEELELFKKFKFEQLKALGFDEIYLVCPGKI